MDQELPILNCVKTPKAKHKHPDLCDLCGAPIKIEDKYYAGVTQSTSKTKIWAFTCLNYNCTQYDANDIHEKDMCRQHDSNYFICTRPKGHDGKHHAGIKKTFITMLPFFIAIAGITFSPRSVFNRAQPFCSNFLANKNLWSNFAGLTPSSRGC